MTCFRPCTYLILFMSCVMFVLTACSDLRGQQGPQGVSATLSVTVPPQSDDVRTTSSHESPNRPSRFVRLVVGCDTMTFEGRETTWEELPGLLMEIPDRANTVLELASSEDVTTSGPEQAQELTEDSKPRASRLAHEHGFADLSEIGTRMLGSRGTARFEAPFEFDKDIPVTLTAGTLERPDIITVHSIRFETRDDQIVQRIDGVLFSWPHTDWRFRIELLDGQGNVAGHTAYNLHNTGRIETALAAAPGASACDFQPIGFSGLTGADRPARFVIAVDQKPLETKTFTRTHTIRGTVMDGTQDFSPDRFTKLERAAASGSWEEWGQAFAEIVRPRPVPNLVITLRGESVTREAVTDAEAKFEFTGLTGPTFGPYGGMMTCESYELSAEMPARPSRTGEKRMATAKSVVTLDVDRFVNLELRADLISVTGRITDTHGKPVAGAKVTGEQEADGSQGFDPHIVSTVSGADGTYELRGLDPPNLRNMVRYLNGGDPTGELGLVIRHDSICG